jgi:uroporphyrinogen decarboxylase
MKTKERTGSNVTLLRNIPPLDVLTQGTPQGVADSVRGAMGHLADRSRIVLSCGGRLPAGVSTGNIGAFVREVGLWKKTRDGYC